MTKPAKLLAAFVVVIVIGGWSFGHAGVGKNSVPPLDLQLPTSVTHCVESTTFMRASHMKLLDKWQNAVVREGQQTYTSQAFHQNYTMSLTKTCMGCHIDRQTFCDRCHTYESVRVGCWNCHTDAKGK